MSYSSTKKEPVSMKLRLVNMKSDEMEGRTKQLEDESRKMEDRLRELKLAMNREKEQREQRGGGHWKSGKQGNLNSHAKDVLIKNNKAKPSSSGKSRKVKVLKDEPVVSSPKVKEKPQPGTLAFLAQRDTTKPGVRQNGPLCGQCEIKSAAVTCQECAELYCSGCFTAFHLKGALAKHHSLPVSKITNSTPRGGSTTTSTPRSNTARNHKPPSTAQTRIVWEQHQAMSTSVSKVIAPTGVSGSDVIDPPKNSLLDGEYDEKEAAQSFQQALADWRKETKDPAPLKPTVLTSSRSTKQPSTELGTRAPNTALVSPVHTPRVNVDEGTSTIGGSTKPTTSYQPEFHSSELSYAEKLLLKRNRRNDIPSLGSSPRSMQSSDTPHLSGVPDEEVAEEGVSFDSILATIQQPLQQADSVNDKDKLRTIIDIQEVNGDELDGVTADSESSYVVSEDVNVSTPVDRVLPTIIPAPTAFFQKSDTSRTLLKAGTRTNSSLQIVDITNSVDEAGDDIRVTADPRKSNIKAQSINSAPVIDKEHSTSRTKRPVSRAKRPSTRNERPATRNERPSSRADRPVSRANTSFHKGSRPRTAAEKAADMFGEGTLTKQPSTAMKEIIAKYKGSERSVYTSSTSYTEALGDFFTAGVKKEFTQRTLTPRREKPSSPGTPLKKHQMSNKIYSLSGKSWRPDSSLGDKIEEGEVVRLLEETGNTQRMIAEPLSNESTAADEQTTIRYSYSASRDPTSSTKGIESVTEPIIQSLADRLSHPIEDLLSNGRPTSRGQRNLSRVNSRASSRAQGAPSTSQDQGHPLTSYGELSSRGLSIYNKVTTPRSVTPLSVRSHTPIVVDGDDMTRYDDIIIPLANQSDDDLETMNDLELELASQTGRLTADGHLSRILPDDGVEAKDSSNIDLPKRSMTATPDTHRDIDRLRESMMDDFEEAELLIMQDEAMRVSLL